MSLVERALKKLQESRSVSSAGEPAKSNRVAPVSRGAYPHATEGQLSVLEHHPAEAPRSVKVAPSLRKITIDRHALRALELLAPIEFERQIANQYQHIKRPLISAAMGKGEMKIENGRSIVLASALPGEGKTFTSINLALSMALEKDVEVLLVDADVAKPHLTRIFGLQKESGLLDLLADSSLHPVSAIVSTDVPGLSILPAGKQTDTATELLASERMKEVIGQLAADDTRRIILFDSPPLLLSTESRALVPAVGQVVLVVRADVTPQRAVHDAIEMIGEERPVSLILNQTSMPASSGYYGYGTYGDPSADGNGKSAQNSG